MLYNYYLRKLNRNANHLWIFDSFDNVCHWCHQVIVVCLFLLFLTAFSIRYRPSRQRREWGKINLWWRCLRLFLWCLWRLILITRVSNVSRVPPILSFIFPFSWPAIVAVDSRTVMTKKKNSVSIHVHHRFQWLDNGLTIDKPVCSVYYFIPLCLQQ